MAQSLGGPAVLHGHTRWASPESTGLVDSFHMGVRVLFGPVGGPASFESLTQGADIMTSSVPDHLSGISSGAGREKEPSCRTGQ